VPAAECTSCILDNTSDSSDDEHPMVLVYEDDIEEGNEQAADDDDEEGMEMHVLASRSGIWLAPREPRELFQFTEGGDGSAPFALHPRAEAPAAERPQSESQPPSEQPLKGGGRGGMPLF
jgi:hypothetical protein